MAKSSTERARERRAQGLCDSCNNKPESGTRCQACKDKKKENNLYKTRIANGMCGGCGKNAIEPGTSLCDICKEKSRLRQEKKRERNRKAGGCVHCGDPLVTTTMCERHRVMSAKSTQKTRDNRRAAGLCTHCGKVPPMQDCVICKSCSNDLSAASLRYYYERKEAGLCSLCNDQPVAGKSLCQYHIDATRDYKKKIKLEVLTVYGGAFCAFCGNKELSMLEVDHIAGGGGQHRRDIGIQGGGHPFYLWLRREGFPPGFRILCAYCNKKEYLDSLAARKLIPPTEEIA